MDGVTNSAGGEAGQELGKSPNSVPNHLSSFSER